jgi:tRNA-specific 2-thiouridylase
MRDMKGQTRKKVFVGMSGGVDSSVSAALLKEQGYDVTGVFIKVWQPDWYECTWKDDRLDAMRVCVYLGIPLLTLNLEEEYKKEVVDYMIHEYRIGHTPNPDVMCNKFVKFGGFFDYAMKQGADFVATGHYAQISNDRGVFRLLSGNDKNKDQSYFLWTLNPIQLSKTIFPVGGLEKQQTRKLARKLGLPVAEKKDSQGLCFIGKVDVKEFLSHYITPKKGSVLNEIGEVIGEHDGALFLTACERHGFTISKKSTEEKPYYVISRNLAENTVTVSRKDAFGNLSIEKTEFELTHTNWISGLPEENAKYRARIRHLGELLPCTVEILNVGEARISFETPLIIAPGQSVVLYFKNICMGGGIAK